ncbi:ComF family protein [Pasteurella sp. PK-2025]|uniref:ComF family protein n=1 Tax=Pasteurella sp. PK-2025 TaxID=3413133 RepID=UPI003C76AB42
MPEIFTVPFEGRWAYMRGVKRESVNGLKDTMTLDVYTYDRNKTPLGGCIHRLKYYKDQTEQEYQRDINTVVDHTINLLRHYCPNFDKLDFIIPAPSNDPHRHKVLIDICREISEVTGVPYVDLIEKGADTRQIKDIDSLSDKVRELEFAFNIKDDADSVDSIHGNVIVIDDIFQHGTTMNECARVLSELDSINDIFGLAITRIGWPDRKN